MNSQHKIKLNESLSSFSFFSSLLFSFLCKKTYLLYSINTPSPSPVRLYIPNLHSTIIIFHAIKKKSQIYIHIYYTKLVFFMASKRKMSEINSSKTLNLDMDIDFVPKTISSILSEVSKIRSFSMKSSTLDFHIRIMEKELKKVESFKRELPCCMQLLQDGLPSLFIDLYIYITINYKLYVYVYVYIWCF